MGLHPGGLHFGTAASQLVGIVVLVVLAVEQAQYLYFLFGLTVLVFVFLFSLLRLNQPLFQPQHLQTQLFVLPGQLRRGWGVT